MQPRRRDVSPPHLVFESGRLEQALPNVQLKYLILKLLNQRILSTQIFDQEAQDAALQSVFDLPNETHNFTFMIDDSQMIYSLPVSPARAKRQTPPFTIYQYLKQRNFRQNEFGTKKIRVKVINHFDEKTRLLKSEGGKGNRRRYGDLATVGPYCFEEI